jgi:hypothetical protein
MATNLEPITAIHFMVGVMDHVGREPQHLALQLPQHGEGGGAILSDVVHGGLGGRT